jgi:hypothetical protein
MPRTKRKKESLGGYFRQVFTEHPDWLKIKSNDLIKAKFEEDHPSQVWTPKIRGNMANIKSVMRKKQRRGGRKPGGQMKPTSTDSGIRNLDGLELAIDTCLSAARSMDPGGLQPVILHLRKARNELVWKMGQA